MYTGFIWLFILMLYNYIYDTIYSNLEHLHHTNSCYKCLNRYNIYQDELKKFGQNKSRTTKLKVKLHSIYTRTKLKCIL